MVRSILNICAASAAALSLAACGGSGGGGESQSASLVLHRGNTAEPYSLDPHRANGTWENNIIGDMFIGLFTENAVGEPIPGMAEEWTVSDDGLVWTFSLREASWSDGEPVTANDFVFALRRILDPATLAQYASLLYPIENAEAVNNGEMEPSELGVRAIDDETLEIRLAHPAPYLPGLLTHYTSFPVPAHVVAQFGDAWVQPDNIQVNGPYRLTEWRTNDFVHVVRNERFFDNDDVCIDEVYYYPTNDPNTAERRVRNGELDLNNEFPGQRIEFFRQEIPEFVQVHPALSTVYLTFNTNQPPFDDIRVRQALAMAIDNEFIVSEILQAGQIAAASLVPPGIANYGGEAQVSWADMPTDERRVEARRLLEEAGYGPSNPLRFEYSHRNTADNPRIAPVLQNDWREIADWVNPDIAGIETQIHYDNLRSRNYQIGDAGWVADYNDAQNYLYLFLSSTGNMNYPDFNDPEYDALMAEANNELDMEARAEILERAEQRLLDAAPIAPLWFQVNKSLVNPRVTGWRENAVRINRTRYLCFADQNETE